MKKVGPQTLSSPEGKRQLWGKNWTTIHGKKIKANGIKLRYLKCLLEIGRQSTVYDFSLWQIWLLHAFVTRMMSEVNIVYQSFAWKNSHSPEKATTIQAQIMTLLDPFHTEESTKSTSTERDIKYSCVLSLTAGKWTQANGNKDRTEVWRDLDVIDNSVTISVPLP